MLERSKTFSEDHKIIEEFEYLLSNYNIDINRNPYYSDTKRAIEELMNYEVTESGLLKIDATPLQIRRAIFLISIAGKILSVKENAYFKELIPHIKLLENCKFFGREEFGTQNTIVEENTNKVFELFIAVSLMRFASEISLAKPTGNKSERPDIIAKVGDYSYGIECKVLNRSTYSEYSAYQLLKAGFKQINKSSDINKGFVLLNTINYVPHNNYLSKDSNDNYKMLGNFKIMEDGMKSLANESFIKLDKYLKRFNRSIDDLFLSNKCARLWIEYLITVGIDDIILNEKHTTAINFYQNLNAINVIDSSQIRTEDEDAIRNFQEAENNKNLVNKINESLFNRYELT